MEKNEYHQQGRSTFVWVEAKEVEEKKLKASEINKPQEIRVYLSFYKHFHIKTKRVHKSKYQTKRKQYKREKKERPSGC